MELLDYQNNVLPWVGKTAKMMAIFITDRFKQHGLDLTLEQMIILKILQDQDGCPQNDLALVTERHKASLTRLLATMEKKNLVAKIPDKSDKRVNRVYVTKTGHQYFQSTIPIMLETMKEIQKGLNEEEIQITIGALQKIQNNITIKY
jgi:DNA-binding MarR family transcriptional regulator